MIELKLGFTLNGDFDSIDIQLILKRMKELNWNIY